MDESVLSNSSLDCEVRKTGSCLGTGQVGDWARQVIGNITVKDSIGNFVVSETRPAAIGTGLAEDGGVAEVRGIYLSDLTGDCGCFG